MPSDNPAVPAVVVPDPARRPNLTGDLDAILVNVPAFRSRLLGYDRLQVDNYVRWAETEMLSIRREVDDLAARYGLCLAEVKDLRQRAAESPEGRQLQQVSERIGEMLRLAADAAAEMRAGGTQEAERLVNHARAEAEAIVAKAHRLHTDAREALAQADATVVQARAEVTRMREQAAAEHAAQVAAMRNELADLANQRDQARQCLSRLSAQIAQALDALAEGLPRDVRLPQSAGRQHVVAGNRVAAP